MVELYFSLKTIGIVLSIAIAVILFAVGAVLTIRADRREKKRKQAKRITPTAVVLPSGEEAPPDILEFCRKKGVKVIGQYRFPTDDYQIIMVDCEPPQRLTSREIPHCDTFRLNRAVQCALTEMADEIQKMREAARKPQ